MLLGRSNIRKDQKASYQDEQFITCALSMAVSLRKEKSSINDYVGSCLLLIRKSKYLRSLWIHSRQCFYDLDEERCFRKKKNRYQCCGIKRKNEMGITAWQNFTCDTCIIAPQLHVKFKTHLIQFLGIWQYIWEEMLCLTLINKKAQMYMATCQILNLHL